MNAYSFLLYLGENYPDLFKKYEFDILDAQEEIPLWNDLQYHTAEDCKRLKEAYEKWKSVEIV